MNLFYSILISILIIILVSIAFLLKQKIKEKMSSSTNVLVIGDSHTEVFEYCNKKNINYNFDVKMVPGATAQGAINPNSKTNALNIFKEYFQKVNCKKYKYIIIMLGEVDCGFVFWVRSKRYNISVDEQMKSSLTNLWEFIDNEVCKYFDYDKIVILGAPLPTIKDNTDKNVLNGARAEVMENQETRTIKTIEYNSFLKKYAEERGCKYIDITDTIIKNKKVNDIYLSDNEGDHHLSNEITYKLWLEKLDLIATS